MLEQLKCSLYTFSCAKQPAVFVQELLENLDFQLQRRQTTNDHQVTCIVPALLILGRYEMDPGKSAQQDHRETA